MHLNWNICKLCFLLLLIRHAMFRCRLLYHKMNTKWRLQRKSISLWYSPLSSACKCATTCMQPVCVCVTLCLPWILVSLHTFCAPFSFSFSPHPFLPLTTTIPLCKHPPSPVCLCPWCGVFVCTGVICPLSRGWGVFGNLFFSPFRGGGLFCFKCDCCVTSTCHHRLLPKLRLIT